MSNGTGEKTSGRSFAAIQTFVAFVSAVVGVIAAVQALASKAAADRSAEAAASFKQELERQADNRAEREVRSRFDSIAYEAVVKVLEMDRSRIAQDVSEKRERAVMALIASTASESMQVALFDVVKTGSEVTPSVRKDAGQAADVIRDLGSEPQSLALAGASAAPPAPNVPAPAPARAPAAAGALESLRGYRIVFFHCQNAANPQLESAQQSLAEQLVSELRTSENLRPLKIAWDTKELPEVLNSTPGYRISSNQIRFNPADNEVGPSVALEGLLRSTATLNAGKTSLERRTVSKRTPNYLSVFLCGAKGA